MTTRPCKWIYLTCNPRRGRVREEGGYGELWGWCKEEVRAISNVLMSCSLLVRVR